MMDNPPESMMNNKKMRWGVFAPMAVLLVATAIVGIAAPQWFYNIQSAVVGFAFSNFGWLFSLTVFVLIFVCLYLGFSKFGKIKIGGDGAKPTMTRWQWFAISLTSGIGTGILFWGTAEPLTHFMNPPDSLGLEPGSEGAATFSIAAVTMQWTIAPYALYVICGIAIGYAHYNKGMPYAVSSALYPIFGKRALGGIGTIVDNVCMFAIAGAMSAILGEGVLQIGSGVSHYTDIVNGPILWAVIAILITITYILSSYTGLQKGIKFLAEQNTRLFLLLLVFVLVVGPTAYIMTIGTQGTGKYLSDFAEMHLWFSPMDGESWPRDWPIFEWALWGANAPLIGMFIARVSYGRTIREFVTINLLLPAAFGAFWFWVFGGAAMYFDWKGDGKLWNIINGEGGVPLSLFAFLDELPLSLLFGILMLIAIFISFTTLADSLTTTMSSLTTTGNDLKNPEPPAMVKIFWGGLIGVLAILTVTAGTGGEISGIDAVKQTATLAGFPVLFLIILIAFSAIRYLRSDAKVMDEPKDDQVEASQLET